MALDWNNNEIDLIIENYFRMLKLELEQKPYNKTYYRSQLLPLLTNRSEGSIEFKHQNISATLIKLGLPFIKGYKPRYNYQQILEEKVSDYVHSNLLELESGLNDFSVKSVIAKHDINYDEVLAEGPELSKFSESEPLYKPVKINYLEREQNNRSLGEKGESFVIEFEKRRLIKAGKEGLADKIEWVSKDIGDGLGYDILSKNENGSDRYLEVKTTKLTKESPIFLTRTELNFANVKSRDFYLYRVFNFDSNPQLFIKNGKYESFCELKAQTFKGYF